LRIVAIHDRAVALDGFDDMGRWSQPLICDRGVECGEIDRPHRLSAEHEGIIAQAFVINLRPHGKITKTVETRLGLAFYAAVEQMDGCQIARVFQRVTQGENAPGTAVVVLWGPVIAVPAAPAADWWQGDRIVA